LSKCVDAAALAQFRERTGYADFGWSVIAREDRLGAIVEPAAYARTGEIVVMIHGGFCTRESWVDVAMHVAQTSAQTLVLVPDVCGYGVSEYATSPPAREHLSAEATLDAVLAWLELIGVRELPTVLAGHSLGAVVVMSADDAKLGPRTSRIAISPVFPAVDTAQRWGLRVIPRMLHAMSRMPATKHLVAKVALQWSSMARAYSITERERMFDAFMALPSTTLAATAEEMSKARPAANAHMQRCIVVLSDHDPIAPAARMERALQRLGFPDSNVYRMVSDGHLPHGETVGHPEWTRRNVSELVGLIDHLLVSAREGTVLPTRLASTFATDGTPGSSTTKN
jgi:pimeloyl-ACP methyl ester carboxylesterase